MCCLVACLEYPSNGLSALRAAVRRLREAGETVVSVLPGDAEAHAAPGFDRELVVHGGGWQLRALPQTGTN